MGALCLSYMQSKHVGVVTNNPRLKPHGVDSKGEFHFAPTTAEWWLSQQEHTLIELAVVGPNQMDLTGSTYRSVESIVRIGGMTLS